MNLARIIEILKGHSSDVSLSRCRLILIAAAFALLQVGIAGYSVGVGNQTIQIPYVQRFADAQMYASDETLNGTIDAYPSYAYRLLALLCQFVDLEIVYAFFHILSCFLLSSAILTASSVLWRTLKPGLICLIMLLAGHHHALAGADLYAVGFTHTWFSFAIAVWSFVLLWKRQFAWSAIVVGLLFNLHALMAVYAAIFLVVMFISLWGVKDWRRLVLPVFLAGICALPTLTFMVRHTAKFSDQWFALMFIRSSHHSFPLSLWQNGDTSIPRFAAIIGIGTLCVPLLQDRLHRRMIVSVVIAAIALFAVGLVGTDRASIVRAQLWRCSIFPLLLAMMCIAHGVWRCLQQGSLLLPHGFMLILTAVVSAIPAFIHNIYFCFCLLTISACLFSLISWKLALLISACHVVCLSASLFIDFPFFRFPSHLGFAAFGMWQIILIFLCFSVIAFSYLGHEMRQRHLLLYMGTVILAGAYLLEFGQMLNTEDNAWIQAQQWARENTQQDAVFLTPVYRSGFRIHSQRAIVAEWRDGTLLYFAPAFAQEWWQRIEALQPGIQVDYQKRRLTNRGWNYSVLNDNQLIELCNRYHVQFLLLPESYLGDLELVYSNEAWHIARPQLRRESIPNGVKDEEIWSAQQAFMRDVVEPNIEKHRKGDLEIEIRDADGEVVHNLKFHLEQQSHAFHFGSGLGFFVEPEKKPNKDFIPSVVKEVDKKHFLELFNFSTIPYSAKWFYIEPEEGKPFYDDLDVYVNWCVKNNIGIEYHFVTGYVPEWLDAKTQEEKQQLLLKHSNELIDRYGDKIHHWQVVNEKYLLNESIAAFQLFRKRLPSAKLGISDCARFYSPQKVGSRQRFNDLTRGLREVRWLRTQGVELDFFALHAHRPFGLWADFRVLYETLDAFEKEGLRIHISEFGIHEVRNIEGDVREGKWDADLQGKYYPMIFSAMFSHPAVDVINMWGMSGDTWMSGSGLVDKAGNAKPAFYALRDLIHKKWHTHKTGKLPLNGKINCRAFYGDYHLQVELTDGRSLSIPFKHQRDMTAPLIFHVDLATARLLQ